MARWDLQRFRTKVGAKQSCGDRRCRRSRARALSKQRKETRCVRKYFKRRYRRVTKKGNHTHFKSKSIPISIKYLDPSYHIRSVAANASDAVLCHLLAEYAVHAGMSGKTNLVIGYWNNFFTHVPIKLATKERRMVDLDSALWRG